MFFVKQGGFRGVLLNIIIFEYMGNVNFVGIQGPIHIYKLPFFYDLREYFCAECSEETSADLTICGTHFWHLFKCVI